MSWIDKAERRLGFIAIPGLIRYVAFFTAITFVLYKVNPHFLQILDLDPAAIMGGQVWRLVTYIFIPTVSGLLPFPDWLNALIYIIFLIWIGNGIEQAWGSFRTTLFFLLGMLGTTVAGFFFGALFSNSMLISSLFLAFARFYPDMIIYFMYILPVKVKWLAWFTAAALLLGFLTQGASYRAALVAAFANYLIFFGPEMVREARQRRDVAGRRRRFESASRSDDEALHSCAVCGATELSNPSLEFRVASNGEEYCLEHLANARTTDKTVAPRP